MNRYTNNIPKNLSYKNSFFTKICPAATKKLPYNNIHIPNVKIKLHTIVGFLLQFVQKKEILMQTALKFLLKIADIFNIFLRHEKN